MDGGLLMGHRFDNLVIPVRKSRGLSTYDVIRRFRKYASVSKVGHSGTLDPPAEGLVLILTGAATKLSGYLMDLSKTYVADIELGSSTDTNDAEGKVMETGDWTGVREEDIRSVLPRFLGLREQVPPMFSALKHRGTPLYTLARRGETIDRNPREVETYSLALKEVDLPVFRIEIACSRGMYVRVLAEEIGEAIGVPAHLKGLERTRIGHFNVGSAVSDGSFEDLDSVEGASYTPVEALEHLRRMDLSADQASAVRNGIAPESAPLDARLGELIRLADSGGRLCAIAEAGPGRTMRLRRVFAGPAGDDYD